MDNWTQLEFLRSEKFDEIIEVIDADQQRGYRVLPSDADILNAFAFCPYSDTKVVILGQDPYPNRDDAHGLAFSVPHSTLPASLKNIYKEMADDIGCTPATGDLTGWATQGVLLLNTSLTVLEGSPGSHANVGWQGLVSEVIQTLNSDREGIVFILWGRQAQAKALYINDKRHLVIRGTHPSPRSANRGGFFGTKPFSTTNKYLEQHGMEPIDWCMS